jgi:hypothetical protein
MVNILTLIQTEIINHFLAQQVINLLKEEYKDATIIDCTLPNEPAYMNTIKCDLHWTEYMSY